MIEKAEKLLLCIGEIDDKFLKEVDSFVFSRKKKAIKVGIFAAASVSVGIAATMWMLNSRRNLRLAS